MASPRFFKGFLSYRQVEPDRSIAESLHAALEAYTLPRTVISQGESRRLGAFFLDRHELAAGSLSRTIEQALERSEYLIVVCSSRTPESNWVAEEIRHFLEHCTAFRAPNGELIPPIDRVLPVLVDSTPREGFPPILLEEIDRIRGGDRGTDLFAPRIGGTSSAEWRREIRSSVRHRLAAGMTPGVGYDDLVQRARKRRRNRGRLAGSVLGTLVLLAAGQQILRHSTWWQVVRVLQDAPVRDVAAGSILHWWDDDASLLDWIHATACTGEPARAQRASEGAIEELGRFEIDSSILCALRRYGHDEAAESLARDLASRGASLPTEGEVSEIDDETLETLLDSLDILHRCGVPPAAARPLLQRADELASAADLTRWATPLYDLVSLARASAKLGADERADHWLERAEALVGDESDRAEVLSARLQLAAGRGDARMAERSWEELLQVSSGTFNSLLALEWDDVFRDLASAWIASEASTKVLSAPDELSVPLERATARLVGVALLQDADRHEEAEQLWRRLVRDHPRLDLDLYDLPHELEGWQEPWREVVLESRRRFGNGRVSELLALFEPSPETAQALALAIQALVEEVPLAALKPGEIERHRRRLVLPLDTWDRCLAEVALARAQRASLEPGVLEERLRPLSTYMPLDSSQGLVRCLTRAVSTLQDLYPERSWLLEWQRIYEAALDGLGVYHPDHSEPALEYFLALALEADAGTAAARIAELEGHENRWRLLAAIGERLAADGASEAEAFFQYASEAAAELRPEVARAEALWVLALAAAERGELRRARLLCDACDADQLLEIYSAVLVRARGTERCSGIEEVSLTEDWL